MKLHSDTLTVLDVHTVLPKGVYADTLIEESRSRKHGIVFRLYRQEPGEAGAYRPRNMPDVYAASYDEHGAAICALLTRDEEAIVGPYEGLHDFHEKTKYHFVTAAD